MEAVELHACLYSPRWGHDDKYTFSFSMDRLTVSHGARVCTAIWNDNTDPMWQGESLVSTMTNDSIYPPDGVEGLLIHLWYAWRDGRLDAAGAQEELDAFVEYLNTSTRAKPNTDFWKNIF